jgi:SAM-dependent methyltransferase
MSRAGHDTADAEPGHCTGSPAADTGEASSQQLWDRRYAAAELIWSAAPNRLLEAEVTNLAPGRALDLGAGEGRNAIWLAERGWKVTAVDFSTVALKKGRRLARARRARVRWILADLLEFRPQWAAFDLVLMVFIQLHRVELLRVLTRAREALAPGGTLIVIGHDTSNLDRGIGGPQDPDRLYTAADIAAALPDLRIRRAEAVARPVATEDGERVAIDAVVRLEASVLAA